MPYVFEYRETLAKTVLRRAVETRMRHAGTTREPGQRLAPGVHDKTMTVGLAPARVNACLRCRKYKTLIFHGPCPQQ